MRVVVVGAGIAGASVALRLAQLGHPATVLEAAPAERGGGYMIDFFGPGLAGVDRLGLRADLERLHAPVEHLRFVTPGGRQRVAVSYPALRRNLFAGEHVNLLRGDLEHLLLAALPAGTVRYGRRVTAVTPAGRPGDPVRLTLADGDTVTADVVVGADGVGSAVRRSVLQPGEWRTRDLHHTVAAWTTRAEIPGVRPRDFTTMFAPGRLAAVYPVPGGSTATFFVHRSADSAADVAAGARATLERSHGRDGWLVPQLLATLPDPGSAQPPYLDGTVQVECRRWHADGVVLLGDAAWCVSLMAGQGAALAVAGGVALAEELAATPLDVAAAFARYEQRLRPVAERAAASGRRTVRYFAPDSARGRLVRDLSVRAGAWPVVGRWVGRRLGVGRAAL
jgi:2-polyprenyl-6-methoxyphenol hydroxylase-like FAD-dependent oxidoreductase